MSQESAAPNQGAAPVTQYREPWTYSERRWEPDFMAPEVKLQPLHKVASKPIVWEGDARLPRGAVTIIAGEHGSGKSLMAIDWAARISRGEPWAEHCASGSATNRNGEPEASASVSNRQPAARINGEPEASASVSNRQAAARMNGEPEASASVSFGAAGSQFKTEANASGSPARYETPAQDSQRQGALQLGTWNLEPGTWNLELGTWNLEPGTSSEDGQPRTNELAPAFVAAMKGRNGRLAPCAV